MPKTISEAGLALVKGEEGCKLTAYQDPRGIWTIGYGHTGHDVHEGMTITAQQASALLFADLHSAMAVVNNMVRVPISQGQFDAMVDFAYNAGSGAFATSDLLKLVNAGNLTGAAAQFGLWIHAGSAVLPDLVKRRAAEVVLFNQKASVGSIPANQGIS